MLSHFNGELPRTQSGEHAPRQSSLQRPDWLTGRVREGLWGLGPALDWLNTLADPTRWRQKRGNHLGGTSSSLFYWGIPQGSNRETKELPILRPPFLSITWRSPDNDKWGQIRK